MNIAFFSSSPLSLPILEKLHQDFSVKLVVTNPDRPIGRKQELTPSPLKTWALKNHILVLSPNSLNTPNSLILVSQLKTLAIDLAVVIDFGLLIPKTVFDTPRLQTINIHFSLLPKYRGPFPDAFVILNGDKTTGISYVLIDEGFDTGDILAQKEIDILPSEAAGQLHQRLYKETENDISYIINSWAKWKLNTSSILSTPSNTSLKLYLPPIKQNHQLATFTKRLSREDGFIKWQTLQKVLFNEEISNDELPDLINCHCEERSDEAISKSKQMRLPRPAVGGACNDIYVHNFFLALSPWPGLWTDLTVININHIGQISHNLTKRLKILKAHMENDQFVIDEVQLESKNPVGWKEFFQGYQIK